MVDANQRDRSWWGFAGSHNVVETDFDIKVPRRTQLDLSVFSSPVSVTGVEGPHKVHGFSSPLRAERRHRLGPGAYVQRLGHHPREVLGANQTIDVDTFSGNIDLHVPDRARGTVTFKSFSGHLNSEMPLTMHSSSRPVAAGRAWRGRRRHAAVQDLQRQRQDQPVVPLDRLGAGQTTDTIGSCPVRCG